MINTKYFSLLSSIAKKYKVDIPLSEKEISKDVDMLDICIDFLLASELSEYGFEDNDELNKYGLELEEAIDHFNRYRIKDW